MTSYMEYPILFKTSTDDFSTQGIGILTDTLSVEITNELNEFPELKLTYSASGDIAKELVKDRIILADVGEGYLRQKFRINEVVKTMDGKIEVSATHILNDLSFNTLKTDINAEAVTPVTAFNLAKDNFEQAEPAISLISSITTPTKITWPVTVIDNAKKLLGGAKGSLLQIYKGEYLFDNETIHFEKSIGRKTGKVIEYGQNLVQVKQEENIADTYTAIRPFAKIQSDGGDQKEEILYLPERVIKTVHFKKFEKLRILTKDFSQDKVTTAEELRQRTNKYISDNKVGIPKVSLSFEMADIKDELGFIDELSMGDEVTVYFAELDINTTARVIKTVWDGLLHRYKTVSIGDKPMTSSDYQSDQNEKLDNLQHQTEDNSKEITEVGQSAGKRIDGKLGFGDALPSPEGHKDGDMFYVKDGDSFQMYQFENGKWVLSFAEGYDKKLREEVEKRIKKIDIDTAQLGQDIIAAKSEAQQRLDSATQSITTQLTNVEKNAQAQMKLVYDALQLKVSKDDMESALTLTENMLAGEIKQNGDTIVSLGAAVTGIQTQVQGIESSVTSQISQLANSIDLKVSEIDKNVSAQIATSVRDGLASIDLRAGDGYISLTGNGINSQVAISGKVIHLTGETKIDRTVIKEAFVKDLAAGKFDAGEISGKYYLRSVHDKGTAVVSGEFGYSHSGYLPAIGDNVVTAVGLDLARMPYTEFTTRGKNKAILAHGEVRTDTRFTAITNSYRNYMNPESIEMVQYSDNSSLKLEPNHIYFNGKLLYYAPNKGALYFNGRQLAFT